MDDELLEFAKDGYADAMAEVGYRYLFGEEGFERNLQKAHEWLSKAAEKDDPNALYNLGYMYAEVKDFKTDYEKAYDLMLRAARGGHEYALEMFEEFMLEDPTEYLEDAALLTALAVKYLTDDGDKKKYKKALSFLVRATNLGYAEAMFHLGIVYQKGEGVRKNPAKAIEWYEKAAALDEVDAMFNLATMYEKGEGVEQNLEKAIKWYDKAATLGDPDALFHLARLNGTLE